MSRKRVESDANVYIMGMMGSGKSTLGPLLAERLGRPFVDTDILVAERTERSIEQLFQERGEGHFRRLESACVAEVSRERGLVVALGGGAIVSAANRRCIRSGYSIYLRVSPGTILTRLSGQLERPLLRGQAVQEKLQSLHRLLAHRERYYLEADLVVDNDGAPGEALKRIAQALAEARSL